MQSWNPRCFHHLSPVPFFWVKLDENPMFKTRDLELHIKWLAGKMSEPDGTCRKNTPFHCGNLRSSSTSASTTTPPKKAELRNTRVDVQQLGRKVRLEVNGCMFQWLGGRGPRVATTWFNWYTCFKEQNVWIIVFFWGGVGGIFWCLMMKQLMVWCFNENAVGHLAKSG